MRPKIPEIIQESLAPHLTKIHSGCGITLPASLWPWLAFFAYQSVPEDASRMLWLVPDDASALGFVRAWEALQRFVGSRANIAGLVSWGVIPYSFSAPDKEKEYQRTRAELLIRSQMPCLVVASAEGMTNYIATGSSGTGALHIARGKPCSRSAVIEMLIASGYQEEHPVMRPGTFCVKGSIIDFFPPDEDEPIRLDFFGDTVESIRVFSHETQRSLESRDTVRIAPLRPDTTGLEIAIRDFLKNRAAENLPGFLASGGCNLAGYADFYPVLRQCTDLATLWQDRLFACAPEKITSRLDILYQERDYLYTRCQHPLKIAPEKLFPAKTTLLQFLAKAVALKEPVAAEESAFMPAPVFGGRLALLRDFIERHPNKKIYFFIESPHQKERLTNALKEVAIPEILHCYYPNGFSNENFVLLTENDVFGRVVRKYTPDKAISRIIESYTDLKEGDYVVHVNYGIARFNGLCRMRVQNTERDFLELVFAENAKLFVPLDQLQLVHKYIGATENPRLDYLGKKSSWAKTRARVRRMVDSIAQELIELYAKRREQKGYAFPPDTSFQHDFEAAFPHTETEHQLAAIQAIKADMESDRPMDRLVCGDVGFGKTEVAIRAAFKAAMAGRQVAVLCPTTILAFQHYRTFSERFKGYPVRIDYLSRFRSDREVAAIKKDLAEGKIDIIIGTHALLSDDIRYRALGLLVVDEEQRFGVEHKEKLRRLKTNIDCLTLTATPIPRTLHMALSGIRELSVIETPPADRRKIETHVLEESEEILHFAIQRELERGGQVYFLHNKVKTIHEQAAHIRRLFPQSRVAVLHGQMPEDAIEEIMIDFYGHAYDILVSTTIIESGIDIPNVNTLIVRNAHEFGLSQLYQLKGRVGRSARQAYAYFFYPPGALKTLTPEAQRRLEVLAEYDDLGAGFRIALKDLEIRGAGNLLGREQSGEIMEVGFELYAQMLEEKIRELRGQKIEQEFHTTVVLPCDWYFPDDYIADTRSKMEFYKAIAQAQNTEEFLAIREALLDRFGPPPAVVECMLLCEEIRHIACALRLEKLALDNEEMVVYAIVSAEHRLDLQKLTQLLSKDHRIALDRRDARRINFSIPQEPQLNFFRELRGILRRLAAEEGK
ncbi:MAG: transcription-repair coupling factor [Leptospiraceae bacterium]|nr:transcription-repair coupling factor [Leptospiraceae bacterium]